jgi:uncharacterized protein (TIGR02996 family)
MVTAETLAGLLRAILEDPADDSLRLVYADCLEENGQNERAEFIRVQMSIYQICRANRVGSPEQGAASLDERISREAVLMRGVWEYGWMAPVPTDWLSNCVTNRGFVAEVRCTCQQWLAHGPGIVAAQPVELVKLIDKQPDLEEDGFWRWYAGYDARDALPMEFAKAMKGCAVIYASLGNEALFQHMADADAALSFAALSWARQQAVLPSLR